MMRIIFISWWWPYPADNGSKLRIYNLIRQLATEHEVVLLSFAEAGEATSEQIAHLRGLCAAVEVVPKRWFQPDSAKALMGYFSPWPRALIDSYSPGMAALVQRYCAQGAGCVIASQLDTRRYLDVVPAGIPRILEEAEVTRYYNQAQAGSTRQKMRAMLTLFKIEHLLRDTLRHGIHVTVASDTEQAIIQRQAPAGSAITVIANGVDTHANTPTSDAPIPDTLIYPGAITYDANYEAVTYFIEQVLPLIQAQRPQVTFTVTGSTGGMDISALAARPGVIFSGYVADVAPVIRQTWATVVPLLSGGGTRLKILESMALGTPVIATNKGAEGLAARPGQHLLIAHDATAMAQAALDLLGNPQQRAQLAQAARTLVEEKYDWAIIGQQLLTLIQQITKEKSTYGQ